MHTIAIAAHALTATIALLAGAVALTRNVLVGLYLWSMVGMEAFLLLAIAVEWTVLDTGARVLFLALSEIGRAHV